MSFARGQLVWAWIGTIKKGRWYRATVTRSTHDAKTEQVGVTLEGLDYPGPPNRAPHRFKVRARGANEEHPPRDRPVLKPKEKAS